MTKVRRWRLPAALAAAVFLLPACSGTNDNQGRGERRRGDDRPSGKVSGKVKYGGKAVPIAEIAFHPEKGEMVHTEVKNGEYSLDRVPAGPVTVTVDTDFYREHYQRLQGMIESVGDETMKAKMKEEAEKIKSLVDVPKEFADPKTSGLKYEIKTGSQEINLDLPKK